MEILRNGYFRCGVGAIVGSVAAPKIVSLLSWAGLPPATGPANDIEYYSIVGIIAGMTAVALAAAFGGGPPGTPTIPAVTK